MSSSDSNLIYQPRRADNATKIKRQAAANALQQYSLLALQAVKDGEVNACKVDESSVANTCWWMNRAQQRLDWRWCGRCSSRCSCMAYSTCSILAHWPICPMNCQKNPMAVWERNQQALLLVRHKHHLRNHMIPPFSFSCCTNFRSIHINHLEIISLSQWKLPKRHI